jgi:hypothetical protein
MQAVIFDVGRVLVHWDPSATLAGLAEISQAAPAELRTLGASNLGRDDQSHRGLAAAVDAPASCEIENEADGNAIGLAILAAGRQHKRLATSGRA